MPKRAWKKTLINNLTSRRRLEKNRHRTQAGQVPQTSLIQDSFQDNFHENNEVSDRPTRAAKERCSQNLTDIIRAERSYDLDVSRERASQRLAAENEEQREKRLQDMRQRAAQRVATENKDQRQRRLQYLRQGLAKRVATENDEQENQMPPKKSNLNNASTKGSRRKRVERARQLPEQIETRNAAQRIRTAERRAQESQEQRDERLQQNIIQLDDVVHMNSELVEQPIEFISLDSLQNSDEHLPQCPPNTSRTKDMPIPKKKSFRKIYCRLCLEQTTNNHMNHLMIMDHNYVGKSEVNKFNKIMQTQRINSMIRVVMPTFDYDLAYNPIICHRCVARLELAYKFITACEDNEKVIRQYKEQFSPNELVSCDDVAENKTLFVKPAVRTYGNESVDSKKYTKPPVPRSVDQTEQVSDVGSGGRESQEDFLGTRPSSRKNVDQTDQLTEVGSVGRGSPVNPTPDTNFEATEFVKCETQEEEYNDEGASSRFVITSEELSCIVKEEIVVKEDIPSEFCDTSADERLGQPETDHTIKDEDVLPLACGTSEYDSHNKDSSGSPPNYKGIRTYHSVGKKRKDMEDTT